MIYKTLPRPDQSNRQIREYLDALDKGGQFVMPKGKIGASLDQIIQRD